MPLYSTLRFAFGPFAKGPSRQASVPVSGLLSPVSWDVPRLLTGHKPKSAFAANCCGKIRSGILPLDVEVKRRDAAFTLSAPARKCHSKARLRVASHPADATSPPPPNPPPATRYPPRHAPRAPRLRRGYACYS